MECDQVLRNFLNACNSFTRNKENQKPTDVLAKHKAQIPAKEGSKDRPEFKAKPKMKKELEVTNRVGKGGAKADYKKKPSFKRTCKTPVVEK
jgi:hypothetical protein